VDTSRGQATCPLGLTRKTRKIGQTDESDSSSALSRYDPNGQVGPMGAPSLSDSVTGREDSECS
jgi:hypothetical protein